MIRSDQEVEQWWDKLTSLEKDEMFEYLMERCPWSAEFLGSLRLWYNRTGRLSLKQIHALRKSYDGQEGK